jgi:hypothetical protein
VAQLGARFHGMEEVVGSIPTRSTKSLNKLSAMNCHRGEICVASCVITRCFGAHSECFHRVPLSIHRVSQQTWSPYSKRSIRPRQQRVPGLTKPR